MTDDRMIIRPTRLCECGLPAGHDSICRPSRHYLAQRVDRQWEEQNAERRAERHGKRRVTFAAERRDRRRGIDDLTLHRQVHERAATMSTVAASAIGQSAPSSESQRVGPPVPQELAADPRWRGHWRALRAHLDQLHELLDEYEGLGTRPVRDLTTEQRNRIVLEQGEGLSCREAAALLPEHTNGKASVVATIRRMQGSGIASQDVLDRRVAISDGRPL